MYNRKLTAVAITVVAAVGLLAAGINWLANNQVKETYTPDNLIRFHVIANSDSDSDQQLKREVRDAILEKIGPSLGQASTMEAARPVLLSNLPAIEKSALATIKDSGQDFPVRTEWGTFKFPTKSYGDLTLPAGEYEAVRVVIGEGEGANWWCVLFPPLCFVDISGSLAKVPHDASGMEPAMAVMADATTTRADHPQVRLKLLDLWQNFRNNRDDAGMAVASQEAVGKKPASGGLKSFFAKANYPKIQTNTILGQYSGSYLDISSSVAEASRETVKRAPEQMAQPTAPAYVTNNRNGVRLKDLWWKSRRYLANITGFWRT